MRNANILEYNQVTIDGILRRYGWQVRFKAASSERVVRTCIDATR